jgi:hypothetical protein
MRINKVLNKKGDAVVKVLLSVMLFSALGLVFTLLAQQQSPVEEVIVEEPEVQNMEEDKITPKKLFAKWETVKTVSYKLTGNNGKYVFTSNFILDVENDKYKRINNEIQGDTTGLMIPKEVVKINEITKVRLDDLTIRASQGEVLAEIITLKDIEANFMKMYEDTVQTKSEGLIVKYQYNIDKDSSVIDNSKYPYELLLAYNEQEEITQIAMPQGESYVIYDFLTYNQSHLISELE